jgi:hypothetical protein
MSIEADPKSLVVTAKKEPLVTKIETNSSFHQVSFMLPAAMKGSFARINATVRAVMTAKATIKCEATDGWLVKVADK